MTTDPTIFLGNKSYFNLPPGPHYFIVTAYVDIGSQRYYDLEPPRFDWTILEEPALDTIITSATDGNGDPVANGSSSTTSTSITFTFTAENNTTDAGFTCVRDDIFIDPCNEGFITYEGLEIGVEHTFRVNAYIPDGEGGQSEVDTTPATWVWTIEEEVFPDTEIILAVDGNIDFVSDGGSSTSGSITFVFDAVVDGEEVIVDGFECSLDNGPFELCSDGRTAIDLETYTGLLPGIHTFSVRFFDDESEESNSSKLYLEYNS